jgi:hypothetical protein
MMMTVRRIASVIIPGSSLMESAQGSFLEARTDGEALNNKGSRKGTLSWEKIYEQDTLSTFNSACCQA